MNQNTAKIRFPSKDFVDFDPINLDAVELMESETGCTFTVQAGDSIQTTLQASSIILKRPAVPLVNGKPQDQGYVLQPGDVITMLFQISGG